MRRFSPLGFALFLGVHYEGGALLDLLIHRRRPRFHVLWARNPLEREANAIAAENAQLPRLIWLWGAPPTLRTPGDSGWSAGQDDPSSLRPEEIELVAASASGGRDVTDWGRAMAWDQMRPTKEGRCVLRAPDGTTELATFSLGTVETGRHRQFRGYRLVVEREDESFVGNDRHHMIDAVRDCARALEAEGLRMLVMGLSDSFAESELSANSGYGYSDDEAGHLMDPAPHPGGLDVLLEHLLAALPAREQRILRLRRFSHPPKRLAEVGEVLGLTRERVRQLELKASRRLNELL